MFLNFINADKTLSFILAGLRRVMFVLQAVQFTK